MKSAALFLVFAVAKAAALAGLSIPITFSTCLAFLWQDAAVAIAVGALDHWLKRYPRASWIPYVLFCLWATVNVAVFRALSTPITLPILRAAGGALSDSFGHYATLANAIRIGAVAIAAVAFPFLFRRAPKPATSLEWLLPIIAVGGYFATAHVDTKGWHRNSVLAFAGSLLPRLSARADASDWRASPLGEKANVENLSALRGAAAGRHVVHIILESTGARYLSTYGAAENPMPRLEALAQNGVVFENAYTTYPESIKGLFAVLCSSYPAFDTRTESYAHVPCDSIAQELGARGYRTALFHSGRFGYLGMEEVVNGRGFHTLEDAGSLGAGKKSSFGLDDERDAVRHVLKWIDSGPKEQPFYIAFLPVAGHHPYSSPPPYPYPSDGEIGSYRNSLNHADAALGLLLDGLKERNLLEETLFIIHGDHGEAFGQHEGNYAHSLHVFEENVRVPLIIAAPGSLSAKRITGAASLIDVAPTILASVGANVPASYQGSVLWDGVPIVALFYADYSTGWLALRDGEWKATLEVENKKTKLYRLTDDPEETRDLSAQFPDRIQAYRDHLLRWSAAQRHRVLGASAGKVENP